MCMREAEWKPFAIGDVFSVKAGKRLEKRRMASGGTPFIGASEFRNGVTAFIDGREGVADSCVLGVNYNGSVCESFYHPYRCVFSDDVRRLKPLDCDAPKDGLILAGVAIRMQKCKYRYAYKFNERRMLRQKIMLPVAEHGSPDWNFMNSCVKSMKERLLARWKRRASERLAQLEKRDIPRLEEKEWKAFAIGELFTVAAGEGLEKRNMTPGDRPFIGASAFSNGVTDFVGNVNGSLDRLVLGVNADGSVGEAFVHPYECLFSNHVNRLHLKNGQDNESILLFCAQSIRMQRGKYSFGYAFKAGRMRKQEIMLPVDNAGEPDWTYMQQYIDNMMIKKMKQFLKFLEAGGTATAPEVQA